MTERKKIRVFYLHTDIINAGMVSRTYNIDNRKYQVIWDSKTPDYIMATEMIYTRRKLYDKFTTLIKKCPKAVTIFCAGECVAPDLNLFDYALVFDRGLRLNDRICRRPTFDFFRDSIFEKENTLTFGQAMQEYKNRKFCCFIYSNPHAHPSRDKLFYLLNRYQKVDSLGKHLNNTGAKPSRDSKQWEKISIRQKSGYRFSIAAENAAYEGYTSEKILTSLQSHSIPVYWGDPAVAEEFNQKAFIDCRRFRTDKELLEEIRRIDKSPELWSEMVSQPWRTGEQRERQNQEMEVYKEFMDHIFSQDIVSAKRIGSGTWPGLYFNFVSCAHNSVLHALNLF